MIFYNFGKKSWRRKKARQEYRGMGKIFLTHLFGGIITLRQLLKLQIFTFLECREWGSEHQPMNLAGR